MRIRSRTTVVMLSAAIAVIGGALANDGVAMTSAPPPNDVLAMGTVSPAKLPRSGQAPVALRMGFQSSPIDGVVPGLDKITFEIARRIELTSEGWPYSCSLAKLYSPQVDARRDCADALVGHGSVTSEITVPGQAPVTVTGRLLAFYAFGLGRPRILAQVTTGEPLPLVYVIPFTIDRAAGSYGTTLSVSERRMRAIKGRCVTGHPNCFAPNPYTLEGVYGYISRLSMSLHRVLPQHGRELSFVKAGCPAPPDFSTGVFPLLRTSLGYTEGASASLLVYGACKALGR